MITVNGKLLEVNSVFSGGELNLKLPNLDLKERDRVLVDCRGTEPELLLKLGLVVNAIKHNYAYLNPEINVVLPYLPYARQDRICNFGEAYGLEFCMDYLASLDVKTITSWDVHSNVATELRKKKKYSHKFAFMNYIYSTGYIHDMYKIFSGKSVVQVLPDEGMYNRLFDIKTNIDPLNTYSLSSNTIQWFKELHDPIIGAKERKEHSVKISLNIPENTQNYMNTFNTEVLIVDDICDGGATFISVVKELKALMPWFELNKLNRISLFVTHGIFRNGTDALYDAGISRIITTDSIPQNPSNHKGEFHVLKI